MHRGDIYLLDLKQPVGSIQAGMRPVIVIQNDIGNLYSPTTIVCGITSVDKKWLPTHCKIHRNGGLLKSSIVLCEQIFTVNKSDLNKYIGTITDTLTLKRLNRSVQLSLGLIKPNKISEEE